MAENTYGKDSTTIELFCKLYALSWKYRRWSCSLGFPASRCRGRLVFTHDLSSYYYEASQRLAGKTILFLLKTSSFFLVYHIHTTWIFIPYPHYMDMVSCSYSAHRRWPRGRWFCSRFS
jgi:hypothetical protein